MATVDAEKKLQKRMLHWLVDDLGYTYLGNLEDIDNTPVKEDLLKANLKKREYSDDQIKTAVSELLSKVNNQVDTLYQINRSVYSLLRYGRQGAKDANGRRQTVHYINWDDIGSNDFYVAEEVSVLRYDKVTRKRPDVVLYINGIALGVFELKSSYVSAGKGIRQMLQNQKRENILNFFSTAQFLFAGNEAEGLFYGTTDTPEKYYLKWKEDKKATDKLSADVKLLQVKEVNRLRDGVISLCHKERFLSLIHDFVIYDAGIKKVTRHNQYFANIAARKRILENEGGIIWNTQGSGKSLIITCQSSTRGQKKCKQSVKVCVIARFGTVARSVWLFWCRWCFGFLWFFWLFLKGNRLSLSSISLCSVTFFGSSGLLKSYNSSKVTSCLPSREVASRVKATSTFIVSLSAVNV